MKTPKPPVDLAWTTAINILQYTGDVSCLKLASEKGFVEFYAWTNRIFTPQKRIDLQSKPEDVIMATLLDEDEYPEGRETAIWVVATESSPCSVLGFVASIGKAVGARFLTEDAPPAKQAKIEEEPKTSEEEDDDGEEEEMQ